MAADRDAAFVRQEAADWLEYFRESANPRTAAERWVYLDEAAVLIERLLAWGDLLVARDGWNIEFRAVHEIDVTECRWADGFVALLPRAALAEDPTFRPRLCVLAEASRKRWEADRG